MTDEKPPGVPTCPKCQSPDTAPTPVPIGGVFHEGLQTRTCIDFNFVFRVTSERSGEH